ncbi:hypothetical protein GCM10027294_23920 [Marinactinospora endophytica]
MSAGDAQQGPWTVRRGPSTVVRCGVSVVLGGRPHAGDVSPADPGAWENPAGARSGSDGHGHQGTRRAAR